MPLVCNHSLSLKTSSATTDTEWTFHTSIVVDHYHQPRPVPYRRYASTLTYGRALMGRASRENISCRGLRWDIFPLRSDYGGTSMAWVGLLKWTVLVLYSYTALYNTVRHCTALYSTVQHVPLVRKRRLSSAASSTLIFTWSTSCKSPHHHNTCTGPYYGRTTALVHYCHCAY